MLTLACSPPATPFALTSSLTKITLLKVTGMLPFETVFGSTDDCAHLENPGSESYIP